jgi:hypothetical protein
VAYHARTVSALQSQPRARPIVVIGMHRSGTSLVARILSAAGVQMGADRNVHDESDFFRELNKQIFRAAHADWDWPLATVPALEDKTLCDNLAAHLAERCASKDARAYLGRRFGKADLAAQTGRWGWKDPRNTCTLPLWLRIFPEAQVVNVYRDGVDVAASLVARERKRAGRLENAIRSSRCLDPDRAFDLWAEYVERSLDVTAELPPARVRDVRYERLVAKPYEAVRELLGFLDLGRDEGEVAALMRMIDPERAQAAHKDPEWETLRRAKASHPLMQRLDYGKGP